MQAFRADRVVYGLLLRHRQPPRGRSATQISQVSTLLTSHSSYLTYSGLYHQHLTPIFTPIFFPLRLWYPGLYEDCESLLLQLERRLPLANVFLVGFSSGTQIIQRTLLHRHKQGRKDKYIKGVMNICVLQDYQVS